MLRPFALAILVAAAAPGHATERLADSSGIQDRDLQVISFFDGRSLITPKAGLDATIALSDGRVSGSIGCGILLGGYEISGNRMRISTHYLLLHRCAFLGPHDAVLTAALTGERIIERDGDRIVLRDIQGTISDRTVSMTDRLNPNPACLFSSLAAVRNTRMLAIRLA